MLEMELLRVEDNCMTFAILNLFHLKLIQIYFNN